MGLKFDSALSKLEHSERVFEYFCKRVMALFDGNPALEYQGMNCVHSIKFRKKTRNSIIEKCERKMKRGILVDENNVFNEIEDFFGIRLIHIHLDQVPIIHEYLMSCVKKGEFKFGEQPKAYTWDPEFKKVLEGLEIKVEFKESFYTSLHYILRNDDPSDVRCELQVRTLFEESWGELDHWLNYPKKSNSLSVREQLLVLSRIVTAGSRLSVSISRQVEEDREIERGEDPK
ncbi:MAG: hypothetical protein ACPGOY_03990 [Rhodospirillaceae bacterium]